jgi:hypothetical protein
MDTVLWILQGLLSAAFLGAGALKLATPREQLVAKGQGWAGELSDGQVKGIGALEVLGALGLVLPGLLGVAEVLTPVAATGLALVGAGAVRTHLRRGEGPMAAPPFVLGVLALFVAIERFGPNPL